MNQQLWLQEQKRKKLMAEMRAQSQTEDQKIQTRQVATERAAPEDKAVLYRKLQDKLLVVIAPEDPEFKGYLRQPVSYRHVAEAATNVLNDGLGANLSKVEVSAEDISLRTMLIQRYGIRDAAIVVAGSTETVPVKLAVYPNSDRALISLIDKYPQQTRKAISLAARLT